MGVGQGVVIPAPLLERPEVDPAGDRMAAGILDLAAGRIDHQRHAVGALGTVPDPHDDVGDLRPLLVADVKEVTRRELLDELDIPLARGARRASDHLGMELAVRRRRCRACGLLVDVGVEVDAEGPVVVPAAEIAAVDSFAIAAGAALLPRPPRRRIPVRDVVVLVFVADEPGRRGDDPLPPPLDRLGGHLQRAVEDPHRNTPRAPFLFHLRRIPLRERHRALLGNAPPRALGVEEKLVERHAEGEPVRALVGPLIGFRPGRLVDALALAGIAFVVDVRGGLGRGCDLGRGDRRSESGQPESHQHQKQARAQGTRLRHRSTSLACLTRRSNDHHSTGIPSVSCFLSGSVITRPQKPGQ